MLNLENRRNKRLRNPDALLEWIDSKIVEYSCAHPEKTFEEALDQYMTYGGLPMVCLEPDVREKEAYLKGLFEKTYLTDIQERYHIRGSDVMGELIDVVASGIGGLTNPTKIENTFKTVKGIGVGKNTIKQYLEILEESFLVRKAYAMM